jgi:hypothetical protein
MVSNALAACHCPVNHTAQMAGKKQEPPIIMRAA